jgi:hypothetical protein
MDKSKNSVNPSAIRRLPERYRISEKYFLHIIHMGMLRNFEVISYSMSPGRVKNFLFSTSSRLALGPT